MNRPGKALFDKIVLECLDPHALSSFYAQLLNWEKGYVADDFVIIGAGSGADIGFQRNEDYLPPVWPDEPGKQQMMAHIDIAVPRAQMNEWRDYAISLGARKTEFQYSNEWIVMLDPEGHPFCLDPM